MPPLTNPDDCAPSKSRHVTNFFKDNGTEWTLEVRSDFNPVSTQRLGEMVLWKSTMDGSLTIRVIEQET